MELRPLIPLCLLFCAGCNLAPTYSRPGSPVPETWPAGGAQAGPPSTPDMKWVDYFTNPDMRSVIQLALDHNRDLKIAALDVEKAQALYRIQRSGLFPDIGVMASGQKSRTPEKMATNGVATIKEQDTVEVGVLSWELDFFGRLRNLKDAALNQYMATEQAQAAVRISLMAAVAQSYLLYAADAENLRLAQATLETQQAYFDLITKIREAGIASDLDLRQAQSQVDAARIDVAKFRGLVAVDRDALDLLAGTQVPDELLPNGFDAIEGLKDVSPGLPSDVLLQRPDILMSEYQLKATYADIGAARAAFFPRVTLTAGIGTMSPDFEDLFSSGTRTWSFAPQILAPIFTGGSLRANVKAAEADRDIAIAKYEKAIQASFREVSDGLIQRKSLFDQLEAQRSLVNDLSETQRLSVARYEAGLDSYLGVLVAQRSLYAAQQGLTAMRFAFQANQIMLYKALGGQM
jgi:outer membrane protein, multidrug efflux system